MQVSIYLREDLVRRLDKLARREKRSRSKVVETLLESSLQGAGGSGRAKDLLSLAGTWQDTRSAEEIIADIYAGRRRNRRSERVRL